MTSIPARSALREALASSSRPATPVSVHEPGNVSGSSASAQNGGNGPPLLTSLSANDGESILCIAVEEESQTSEAKRIYAGSQGGHIHVWDAKTYGLRARLSGHDGAVLSLVVVKERQWLISSSGDGTIRVWHTPSLTPLYTIHPPHDNVGDVLSLAWLPASKLGHEGGSLKRKYAGRLFAGAQDTSIQWIDLPPAFLLQDAHPHHIRQGHGLSSGSGTATPSFSPPIHKAPNKFFDSLAASDRPRSRLQRHANGSSTSLTALAMDADASMTSETATSEHVIELQFDDQHIEHYAHYGYVYCLTIAKSNDRPVLVSGSGDERVKVWHMNEESLLNIATLESTCDAVLAIAAKESTVFAGHQSGIVKIWDLDTFECIRSIRTQPHDILSVSVAGASFFTASAAGTIQQYDGQFAAVASWTAHSSIALSSTVHDSHLITGGNDALLKVWDVSDALGQSDAAQVDQGFQGQLYHTLNRFIGFKTIASDEHREECRQGAQFLKSALRDMGAQVQLLPAAPGRNPVVMATFRANSGRAKKRVLFYGHYDVISASPEQWSTDPFSMTGKNGWLYGRGVSDNKGPILAVAAAAAELRQRQELDIDLVMLIEGEEETGSAGFQAAVSKNKHSIGEVDVVLVANSYWLGDDLPCLTFGLRGVIHATVKIKSDQPDLHSGIHGGVVNEPLLDMAHVLASLTDAAGRVRIGGFLDQVKKLNPTEERLYEAILERYKQPSTLNLQTSTHVDDPKQDLMNRWRQPALSVHDIQVAGSSHKSVIPSYAQSAVSIRTVPDQPLEGIVASLKQHLRDAFSRLRTRNELDIEIEHVADWWLGDIESPYFVALAECIERAWGTKPLYIREGGSIPSLPFLEREFGASAVHFPMGTSSDRAHLPNERTRILNLEKGKTILQDWFVRVAEQGQAA